MIIKFSDKDKQIGQKLFEKFKERKEKDPKWPLLNFDKLFKILNKQEKQLIEKILTIDYKEIGLKKQPFFGIKSIPKNLVIIKKQSYKDKEIKPQFLPKNVFLAFQKLNNAIKKDIDRSLKILSGYRSPAYQSVVLFCNLYKNNWDINKTLRQVALPGYSEHGYPKQQGIDFGPEKAITDLKNFYKTKEYKWLLKNAKKFDFYLSYPSKGNKFDTIFEPWHWHYKK